MVIDLATRRRNVRKNWKTNFKLNSKREKQRKEKKYTLELGESHLETLVHKILMWLLEEAPELRSSLLVCF